MKKFERLNNEGFFKFEELFKNRISYIGASYVDGLYHKEHGYCHDDAYVFNSTPYNTSISFDESVKWDSFALSTPLSRKDIVVSKYILLFILLSIGTLLASAGVGIINLLLQETRVLTFNQIMVIGIYLALILLIIAIMLPFIFKFGAEKSRMMIAAIVAVPYLIILLVSFLKFPTLPQALISFLIQYSWVIILVVVGVALMISMGISIKIYQKKQF